MYFYIHAPLLVFRAAHPFATLLPSCLDSGGETAQTEGAAVSALRQSFPEQADEVLAPHGESFRVSEQGFALAEGAEERRRLAIELPREASGAVLIRGEGGFEVRVRESGLEGKGELAEGAVAYRRAGGTSFWTARAGGVEEWLHLKGVGHAGEAVAAWQVEGASLRQQGEMVEVVDASGWTRLFVTAPVAYAAGGREVKARLEVRGGTIELFVDAQGEAVLVDPLWAPAGSMSVARVEHTMTRLADGRVLVVGGVGSDGSTLRSPELYNPANNTWSGAGGMSTYRRGHSATLLNDGRVLVAGGYGIGGFVAGPCPCPESVLKTAEIYNPASNTWSSAGTMNGIRVWHTGTLLGSGKVLVVGGANTIDPFVIGPSCGNKAVQTAEVYDPGSNTWSDPFVAGSTLAPPARYLHTATRLGNGKVLVAGGRNRCATSNELQTAYLFNEASTSKWETTGMLSGYRESHTATPLGDGRVLVAGGLGLYSGSYLASAEIYNPQSGTWTTTPGSLGTARSEHTATLLGNGKVLVAGGGNGYYLASAELFNPTTQTWTTAGSMSNARGRHTATPLGGNTVLVAGGTNDNTGYLASAEMYTGQGVACSQASDCPSGFCADGVCCNTACNAGPCDACSVAAGAAVDGTCALLTGPACNDGNSCTQTDTCQAGTCTGANPVTCSAPDACHNAGTCNPTTGTCATTVKPDGTPCSLGTCQGGICSAPATSLFLAALAAGSAHSLALLHDGSGSGSAYAWGSDSSGQLGDGGTPTNRASPIAIPGLAVRVDDAYPTLAAGGSHSLAITFDGSIAAWGSDAYGQLGNDLPKANTQSPVSFVLPAGAPAVTVAAGRDHSLAIDTDGRLWAWGRNLYGQLGDGTQFDRAAPVQVTGFGPGLRYATAIAAGGDHSFALDSDGRVWAWGRDAYGQLGDTTTLANQLTPAAVALPSGAVVLAVASGTDHGMALLADDTVWTWGRDASGQLGDDSSLTNKPTPVQVATLSGVAGIAAGGNHSLARRFDNTVWSWGADTSGQLGDDAPLANKPAPVAVNAAFGASMLAGGGTHSLFGSTNRTIYAAGSDGSGQLGNGSPLANQPVAQSFTLVP